RARGACSGGMGLWRLCQRSQSYGCRFSAGAGDRFQGCVLRHRICYHRLVGGKKIPWAVPRCFPCYMTGPEVTQNEKLTEAGATADEPAIPVARALTSLAAGPMLCASG